MRCIWDCMAGVDSYVFLSYIPRSIYCRESAVSFGLRLYVAQPPTPTTTTTTEQPMFFIAAIEQALLLSPASNVPPLPPPPLFVHVVWCTQRTLYFYCCMLHQCTRRMYVCFEVGGVLELLVPPFPLRPFCCWWWCSTIINNDVSVLLQCALSINNILPWLRCYSLLIPVPLPTMVIGDGRYNLPTWYVVLDVVWYSGSTSAHICSLDFYPFYRSLLVIKWFHTKIAHKRAEQF